MNAVNSEKSIVINAQTVRLFSAQACSVSNTSASGRSSRSLKQTAYHLTNREKDVLSLIACGYSNKHAARKLEISPYTIAGYIKDIYRKLNISCRAEATVMAIRAGLLDTSLLT